MYFFYVLNAYLLTIHMSCALVISGIAAFEVSQYREIMDLAYSRQQHYGVVLFFAHASFIISLFWNTLVAIIPDLIFILVNA